MHTGEIYLSLWLAKGIFLIKFKFKEECYVDSVLIFFAIV